MSNFRSNFAATLSLRSSKLRCESCMTELLSSATATAIKQYLFFGVEICTIAHSSIPLLLSVYSSLAAKCGACSTFSWTVFRVTMCPDVVDPRTNASHVPIKFGVVLNMAMYADDHRTKPKCITLASRESQEMYRATLRLSCEKRTRIQVYLRV